MPIEGFEMNPYQEKITKSSELLVDFLEQPTQILSHSGRQLRESLLSSVNPRCRRMVVEAVGAVMKAEEVFSLNILHSPKALDEVVKTGLALGCSIGDTGKIEAMYLIVTRAFGIKGLLNNDSTRMPTRSEQIKGLLNAGLVFRGPEPLS